MEILILTIFVSLALALLGVGFFVWTVRSGTGEHADRLALLPLEEDAAEKRKTSPPAPTDARPAR